MANFFITPRTIGSVFIVTISSEWYSLLYRLFIINHKIPLNERINNTHVTIINTATNKTPIFIFVLLSSI